MKTPEDLRSRRWFGPADLRSFGHRSRAKQMGWDSEDWEGKPVIGILNTWSDLNTCHTHFKIVAEQVRKGVLQAGGLPVEMPVMSVGEMFTKPTSMLYRNFLAMETEETLRCNPIDGAVLLGGCDKTPPALLMGALSMNIPVVYVPAGPMLRGNWRGEVLGSGSDVWKYWDEKRAGNITDDDWAEIEEGIARSPGTCMTMGTASTMTSIAESMGFTLPGASSIPASDSNHQRMAAQSGRQAVENVWQDRKPTQMATMKAFENAIITDMAIGGSTNAIVHLVAMAGRAGLDLPLETFDEISQRVPFILDVRPSGRFLMEDFYYAGGLRALLNQLGDLLHLDCPTVNGKTLGENIEGAKAHNTAVIRLIDNPVSSASGTAILRGNLAPNGAVIKQAAADPRFWQHTGLAVVFKDYSDLAARIDDPDLDVTENSVLVLQNVGPKGAPGMPEWGMLPIPKKLLEQGVRDMVRVSDARMSGTSYGTCVLHVSPESAIGGPLALLQDGDEITLNIPARQFSVNLTDAELEARRAAWSPPAPHYTRGYGKLYLDHVTQAEHGCDFDFLHGEPASVAEPEIH
ncbi:MAG: dihydroxy-acid dehydratase [Verrucomicrobiaceae bacterium]|nr:dihydroxy-acid dehydratase [Verrucomicrobiaceae bacterium]